MESIPIICLEEVGMRHAIRGAFHDYRMRMDVRLQSAFDAYCTEDNISRVLSQEMTRVLDEVIQEEVRRFFFHGEGRQIIREAIAQRLKE